MKNKGFTLVEILAAVTILALLALITVPAVTKPIKDSKNDLYKAQLSSFKESAKGWGVDNMYSTLPEIGDCIIVNLDTLIASGLVEPSIKNPKTGEEFDSGRHGIFVKIYNAGTNNKNKYVYEVYDCTSSCYSQDSDETNYNDIIEYEGNQCTVVTE